MKKKLIITFVVAIILGVVAGVTNCNFTEEDVQKVSDSVETIVNTIKKEENDVIVSEQTKELVIKTKESLNKDEDISTTEEIESSEIEENELEIEQDALLEQEHIEYNGDSTGDGLSLLGKYQGLTYYSQADNRWANVMYSSIGDTSQTMKSSACGPTSAAMVVSSSKGTILPTTMASLAVDNGYRTVNSGTAWSFFPFIADYFYFNEYHSTGSFDTMLNYLKQKDDKGNNKYYVIASCGSGLFTSGGHYIVLVADNNNIITVYDPYLYNGKFSTASRRVANVTVSGNSAYVSETAFKTYANYKNFWIFSNDGPKKDISNVEFSKVSYTRYVATQSSNLNVRNSPNGNKVSSLKKGTQVNVVEVNGNWSKISSPISGWVSTQYLSSSIVVFPTTTQKVVTGYKNGTYKVNTNIHVRTGPGTNYKTKTYKQLTANARNQNKRYGNYYYNGYKKGIICTVTQIKGNWGKTVSGWICLSYCEKL